MKPLLSPVLATTSKRQDVQFQKGSRRSLLLILSFIYLAKTVKWNSCFPDLKWGHTRTRTHALNIRVHSALLDALEVLYRIPILQDISLEIVVRDSIHRYGN